MKIADLPSLESNQFQKSVICRIWGFHGGVVETSVNYYMTQKPRRQPYSSINLALLIVLKINQDTQFQLFKYFAVIWNSL